LANTSVDYYNAHKRNDQSYNEFLQYLESLEKDAGIQHLNELQRVRFYFAKIPADVRTEIITRTELNKILTITHLFDRCKAIEAQNKTRKGGGTS